MKGTKMLAILVLALGLVVWAAEVSEAGPMGTAFTYQGHLYDANHVANGLYDFQFKLYDANIGAGKVGNDVNVPNVDVIDGYFTVELDFGAGVFNGEERWLEIGVRPGDSAGSFTALSPRQKLTHTPFSHYARYSYYAQSARVGRCATFVVAANDSSQAAKDQADYVCDGVADEVEINAALTAGEGGKIYCTAGTYECAGTIWVPSNTILEFEPGNLIHCSNDITDETRIVGSYARYGNNFGLNKRMYVSALIANENCDPNGDVNVGIIGAYMDWEAPTGVDKFPYTQSYAGILLNYCKNSYVRNCTALDVVFDAYAESSPREAAFGILLYDCSNCIIEGCTAKGAGYENIGIRTACYACGARDCWVANGYMHNAQSTWNERCFFDGLKVTKDDTTGKGIDCDSITDVGYYTTITNCQAPYIMVMSNLTGVQVTNNQVDNIRCYGPPSVDGLTIDGLLIAGNIINGSTGIKLVNIYLTGSDEWNLKNIVITDNILTHASSDIRLGNDNTGTLNFDNIIIRNNRLQGDIIFDSDAANSNTIFTDVTVSGNTASAIQFFGDCAGNSVTRANISGNILSDAGYKGLVFDSSGSLDWDISDIIISNNIFNNCILWIEADSGACAFTDILFSGNRMNVSQTTYWRLVLLHNAGTSDWDRITLQNNHFESVITGYHSVVFVDNDSTGNTKNLVVRDNTCYMERMMYVSASGSGDLDDVSFIGNTGYFDDAFIVTNSGDIDTLVIRDNVIKNCTYVIQEAGTCAIDDVDIINNDITYTTALTAGTVTNLTVKHNEGSYLTENTGSSTGTGAEQMIAHGLGMTPTVVIISGDSTDVNGYQSTVADATNIYITADNGEAYHWEARVR